MQAHHAESLRIRVRVASDDAKEGISAFLQMRAPAISIASAPAFLKFGPTAAELQLSAGHSARCDGGTSRNQIGMGCSERLCLSRFPYNSLIVRIYFFLTKGKRARKWEAP
jgi:hypothetical protein